MSWVQRLYETYKQCAGREAATCNLLSPVAHTTVEAHIEIVLDEMGNFSRARVLGKADSTTLIPCTEDSAGRSGKKPANHPLCDKLQYVAGDYVAHGGDVTSGFVNTSKIVPEEPEPFRKYKVDLSAWHESSLHPVLTAILKYIDKKQVVSDLVKQCILPTDGSGKFVKAASKEEKEKWPIWKAISNNSLPEDAVVRWRVETPGKNASGTWEDISLIESWIQYYLLSPARQDICLVNGNQVRLASIHPAKLRHGGDKAKLISSNDTSGSTFRGRFEEADQACTVGFDITQKAHNALRWLLSDQKRTFRNGEQAIVAWETAGHEIPALLRSSDEIIDGEDELPEGPDADCQDAGLFFAQRLKRKIAGYQSTLGDASRIIVMVLDAATPGRMAIAYYRELTGSEFLTRLDAWHTNFAWAQRYSKERNFVGAPAPRDIAEAAFGHNVVGQDKSRKLLKATVERLLPCIIDGVSLPSDLLQCTFNRACHPQSMPNWEWRKVLGIACALYKGTHPKENYQMSLETERITRDYLYGRLLAVADRLEGLALYVAGETRDTNAAKLLPRFAVHPYSTWLQLEIALNPYQSRLRAKRPSVLIELEKLMRHIMHDLFEGDDFRNDSKLSGEFLLAYHCQNKVLWDSWKKEDDATGNDSSAETETTSSTFNKQ